MFWKRKPPEPMNAGEAWLLAALKPYLDLLELPSEALVEPSSRTVHRNLLETAGYEDRDTILSFVVYSLYRGERVAMARAQRANGQVLQTNALVYDALLALTMTRAGLNAGVLEDVEAKAIMFAIGRRLQGLFGSWRDFVLAFAQVYSLQQKLAGQDAAEIARDMNALHVSASGLLEPDGLWQMIPWTLGLPDGEAELERATRTYLTVAIFYRHENSFGPSGLNWCLAVAAIYRAWWGEPIDSLEPAEMIPNILERDWGVTNRAELLETLGRLLTDGHLSDLQHMQSERPELPQDHPLAWDLVRFMQVASSAACAGYITPEECANLMLHAAKPLQAQYSSWSQMIAAFKVGRDLWMAWREIDPDEDTSLDDMLEILESDARSPCQKVPWSYLLESLPDDAPFAVFPQVFHNRGLKYRD